MSPWHLTPALSQPCHSHPPLTQQTTQPASTYLHAQPTMCTLYTHNGPLHSQPNQQPMPPLNHSQLSMATQSQLATPTHMPPPTPPTSQQNQPQPTILTLPLCDNLPWGDTMHLAQPHDFFRVLSKNVRTLNANSLDMTAIATKLHTMNTSIFLAQETNIVWNPATL